MAIEPKTAIEEALRKALREAAPDLADTPIILERPKQAGHGDFSSNLALQLAKALKKKPRELAVALQASVSASLGDLLEKSEVAGPGFINFKLKAGTKTAVIRRILEEGAGFGRTREGRGEKVQVEFVSANPTGPLHVGHGRQAALGDAIAALLEWTGWKVSREFYYNDAGAQIDNLAISVQARVRGSEIPEGGYHGEYIKEIAERYVAQHPNDRKADDLSSLRTFAVKELRKEQDRDLQAFGVRFDTYFLESSLYSDGKVEETISGLKKSGHTYDKDGALWLRTTEYGDDKDRVVVRSEEKGGAPTYLDRKS